MCARRAFAGLLAEGETIGRVVTVHWETTIGILNPIEDIAAVCEARGRRLLVDDMSSFDALPIDLWRIPCEVFAASANNCLKGVLGICFVYAHQFHTWDRMRLRGSITPAYARWISITAA